MDKLFFVWLTIGVVVILTGGTAALAQESGTTFERIEEPLAEMEADYAYALFRADSKYISWIEYHQSKVFVYDLSNGNLQQFTLREGRGPGEYLAMTDIVIEENFLYISDPTNGKLIRIDITSGDVKDIPLRTAKAVQVVNHEKGFSFLESINPTAFIRYYNLEDRSLTSYEMNGLNIQEEFKNPFNKHGRLTSGKKHVVLATQYRPYLYVFEESKKSFIKRVIFDPSDEKESETTEEDGEATVMFPPSEVDILVEDAIQVTSFPNRIFILARGQTDNRRYQLDKLYEYDFIEEEFVGTHDLGIKAADITVNGKNLFVFSEEDFKVYQYEIHNDD